MNLIQNKLTVGAEKPFRFLHMSDTHFTLADDRDDLRKRELAENRTKWHSNAERISEEAEAYARENGLMIAHTGDYIDFVSAANLDRLKRFTDENDVFFAAGNHEFSLYVGEAFEDAAYREISLARVQACVKNNLRFASKKVNGVNLIAIDNGYYLFEAWQLDALKKEAAYGLPMLLFMHTPLYDPDLYRIMGERPMTIRYLDPPLHEFLPTKAEDIEALAKDMGMTAEELNNVVVSLHEFNPMMGHRGCRLAVTYPEIAEMQTNAVIKAALKVSAETGKMITPHIMIPLVGEVKELKYVKEIVVATADKLIAEAGVDMKYLVGTMIEIPRAALTAGDIAKEAEFFSFGTNDLTQMTFGFSRDDAAKFLGAYYEKKIYESDPFQHLDQIGVGKLIKMAAHDGRETRPDLGLGICGEHGGDPSSVEFCHNVGLDYVSCSPFRVPIARLAAAQAAIKNPRK